MKGDWILTPGGQVVLDTTEDPTEALDAANARAARMKAQRDQVQAAHDLLASQLSKVEAAIASAGLSIQQAEQP